MKKKLLSMMTAFVMAVSLFATNVAAANGPVGAITDPSGNAYYLAYIKFFETTENGNIKTDESGNTFMKTVYANDIVSNELENAVYDKATNTLTITDLSVPDMMLDTNMMGDDFKLKVIGNCTIGQITVWGDGYGGSLTIEGTGTLNVNPNNVHSYAILLRTETAKSSLHFGKNVIVNLSGQEAAAYVRQVPYQSAADAITFANGQKVNLATDNYKSYEYKYLTGYLIGDQNDPDTAPGRIQKVENSKDPSGIYGATPTTRQEGGVTQIGYTINKLIYNETHNCYFADTKFVDNTGDFIFVSTDNLPASDYSIVYDSNNDPVMIENVYSYPKRLEIYMDGDDNEYGIYDKTVDNNTVKQVYDYSLFEGMYVFTENSSVSYDNLFTAYDVTVFNNLFDHVLNETSFTYQGDVSYLTPISLVDIGNVWTALNAENVVPFTGELNPNQPELANQMEIVEEAWKSPYSSITSAASALPLANQTYSYSITLKAKAGYTFTSGFRFVYGGSTPANYSSSISEDGTLLTLSGFIPNVTVASPKVTLATASVNGIVDKTYTGKAITLNLKLTYNGSTLKAGTDYTVSYKNNKNVGTATVTLTGKGRFNGSMSTTFRILPKGTTLSKLKKGSKRITVSWKKQSKQITGYQLQYSTSKNCKKSSKIVTVSKAKTTKTTLRKLKAKKKYYVRIRTYKKIGKYTYTSSWSKAKSVTTK